MPMPPPVSLRLTAGREWRLSVFNLGLACCAVEFAAATLPLTRDGAAGDGGVTDVLVVSGTVTTAMAAGIRAAYDELPPTRRVLAFGACATTGGPYWDSYSVIQGVDALIPVDIYVPGCPPRPEALLAGLRKLDLLIGTTS